MIRYYETTGLIRKVARTDAGYRQYSPADIHILRFIRRARDLGFSLDRIRLLVSLWGDTQRKSADVKQLADQYIEELNNDIAKLQSIRGQLQSLVSCCHGDNRPDCPILEDLAGEPVQPQGKRTKQITKGVAP
jgi:MerR family copper efflux transcriptional regulator